jgi:hypothetical protein
MKGSDQSEDRVVDGRILEWMLEKQGEDVDWINLAQDRDQWRSLVSMIMTLRVPQRREIIVRFSKRTLLNGVN